MVRRNQGPELERARPVINNFISYPYNLLSSSYMFFIILVFFFQNPRKPVPSQVEKRVRWRSNNLIKKPEFNWPG
jgi:hypothetical protein